jgi:hypothetical protein
MARDVEMAANSVVGRRDLFSLHGSGAGGATSARGRGGARPPKVTRGPTHNSANPPAQSRTGLLYSNMDTGEENSSGHGFGLAGTHIGGSSSM